ncbi:MAG: LLM class flavin-dependent oxidoreductase [Myxococcota bacterium]
MSVRIGVGLGLGGFPFDSIHAFRKWLDACEDSAIDSIWQSDRVVSREPALEPMTLLSVVAGATQRLKFGTNAVVLPFRDPVTFARQCATLDFLSDGRFLPAVAIGRGDAPEWEATGRSPKGRGKRADEALEVMTRLWAGESVDFEGEFFSLKGATIAPRPKQQPLPLWLGGSSAAAIRRTARYGNGWLAPLQSPAEAAETVQAIREEGQRIGKPIPDDHYGATILFRIEAGAGGKAAHTSDSVSKGAPISKGAPLPKGAPLTKGAPLSKGAPPAMRARLEAVQAIGDAGDVLDRLKAFRAGGVTKFIAIPLAKSAEDMIEQCRLLDAEVLPHAND